MNEHRIICDACGGSGQQSHFLGVSRFLLTVEECDLCGGLGFLLPEDDKTRTGENGAQDHGNEKN